MFGLTLTGIVGLIKQYGYIVIFPIAILEGPIITIISGFLVSLGLFNLYVVYLILILGDLCGDILYYSIGRFGAGTLFKHWGKFFGVSEEKILRLKNYFKKHEMHALLLGKTQPTGSIILAIAGLVKMKFDSFFSINFLGTVIKTAILLGIGYFFGKSYVAIDNYFTKGAIILLAITVVLVIVYIKHNKNKKL